MGRAPNEVRREARAAAFASVQCGRREPRSTEAPGSGANEEEVMNVRPLADRILIRRIEEKETMRGGIIIPDTAKEKPQEGEVVAVGPGRLTEDGKRIAMDVKKGDRVLMGKYSGTDVKIDGTEYVILREDDVLGVLSSEAK
jgi:chaperonin GroES